MRDATATAGIAASLVICTRNRARQLEACLDAVAKIRSARSWEIVVVDNGSRDSTRDVVARFLESGATRARCVREPEPGLSRARNAGIAASVGEIVAFTDDDCYPAADFIDRTCDVFADERIGFIGGRILLHDPSDYPLTVNESTESVRFAAGGVVPCAAVQGANMAFRRTALLAVGGFDPALGAGTRFPAEDWDIVARICVAGWDGGYFPAPTVSHHHGRNAGEAHRQLRTYHYASGAVYAKLLLLRDTRRLFAKHWARRILGDAKYNQRKLLRQFRGAVDYWRSVRTAAEPGGAMPAALDALRPD